MRTLEPHCGQLVVSTGMTRRTEKICITMAAIAAVLAFPSSRLSAQAVPEVTQPVPAPPVVAVPDITPETAAPSEPSATSATDPVPAEPTITPTKSSSSKTPRRTAASPSAAKTAPPVARPPVAAPAAEPSETAVAPSTAVPMPAPPPPVIAATPPAQNALPASNGMLPIAGAVGLGLLGLIGLGVAMRRRKLRRDEEFVAANEYETASEAPPQPDPLLGEPSFAPQPADPGAGAGAPIVAGLVPAAASASARSASTCDDTAPGSHVEAACEGPTPDNPSLSIKKRLKRAHFFDQREFLAAAGEVAPMAPDAGLPDATEVPAPPIDKPT